LNIKPEAAFNAIDKQQKGYFTLGDMREFIKDQNMYPIEKNLGLLFERFDKNGSKSVTFDEYHSAVTPFLTGIQQSD